MDAKEYLRMLGKRRWELMTDAQKQAHIRCMVAGQKKARKHRKLQGRPKPDNYESYDDWQDAVRSYQRRMLKQGGK